MMSIIDFIPSDYKIVFINIICLVCLFLFFLTVVLLIKSNNKLTKERKDAVKRSRAVIQGQMAEQMAPFFPNFPCNPNDVKFIGKPIDFIGFSEDEIVFIEMKTGNSQLSEKEKKIKKLIEDKKVRYVEYKVKF